MTEADVARLKRNMRIINRANRLRNAKLSKKNLAARYSETKADRFAYRQTVKFGCTASKALLVPIG